MDLVSANGISDYFYFAGWKKDDSYSPILGMKWDVPSFVPGQTLMFSFTVKMRIKDVDITESVKPSFVLQSAESAAGVFPIYNLSQEPLDYD